MTDWDEQALTEDDPLKAAICAMYAGTDAAEKGQPESACRFGEEHKLLRQRWLEGHRMFRNIMEAKVGLSTLPISSVHKP